MGLVTLGASGLPVQVTPVLPQTPPAVLTQPPLAAPPTAVAKLEPQAGSGEAARGGDGKRGNAPAAGARGGSVDIKV